MAKVDPSQGSNNFSCTPQIAEEVALRDPLCLSKDHGTEWEQSAYEASYQRSERVCWTWEKHQCFSIMFGRPNFQDQLSDQFVQLVKEHEDIPLAMADWLSLKYKDLEWYDGVIEVEAKLENPEELSLKRLKVLQEGHENGTKYTLITENDGATQTTEVFKTLDKKISVLKSYKDSTTRSVEYREDAGAIRCFNRTTFNQEGDLSSQLQELRAYLEFFAAAGINAGAWDYGHQSIVTKANPREALSLFKLHRSNKGWIPSEGHGGAFLYAVLKDPAVGLDTPLQLPTEDGGRKAVTPRQLIEIYKQYFEWGHPNGVPHGELPHFSDHPEGGPFEGGKVFHEDIWLFSHVLLDRTPLEKFSESWELLNGDKTSIADIMDKVVTAYFQWSVNPDRNFISSHDHLHLPELLLKYYTKQGWGKKKNQIKEAFIARELKNREFSSEFGYIAHYVETIGILLNDPEVTWSESDKAAIKDYLAFADRFITHSDFSIYSTEVAHFVRGLRLVEKNVKKIS